MLLLFFKALNDYNDSRLIDLHLNSNALACCLYVACRFVPNVKNGLNFVLVHYWEKVFLKLSLNLNFSIHLHMQMNCQNCKFSAQLGFVVGPVIHKNWRLSFEDAGGLLYHVPQ